MPDRAGLYDATIPGEPNIFPPLPPPPDPDVPDVPDDDIPVQEPNQPVTPPIPPDVKDPPLTPTDRPYQMKTRP